MTERARLRCLNCGHRFEQDVLTQEERQQARREDRPTSPIACPMCRRTDTRRGWD